MIEAGRDEPKVDIKLYKIPLFAHLQRDQIERLRSHLRFSQYRAGELVTAEGQDSHQCIFIIIEGAVSLCKKAPHAQNGSELAPKLGRIFIGYSEGWHSANLTRIES
jgi:hypothetical protein